MDDVDVKRCTKNCGAVFHMTGHRHVEGCPLHDPSPGCPTCGSPSPALHPSPYKACTDAFHSTSKDDEMPTKAGMRDSDRQWSAVETSVSDTASVMRGDDVGAKMSAVSHIQSMLEDLQRSLEREDEGD